MDQLHAYLVDTVDRRPSVPSRIRSTLKSLDIAFISVPGSEIPGKGSSTQIRPPPSLRFHVLFISAGAPGLDICQIWNPNMTSWSLEGALLAW